MAKDKLLGKTPREVVELEWQGRLNILGAEEDELVFCMPTVGNFEYVFVKDRDPKSGDLSVARFGFEDGRWSGRHICQEIFPNFWRDSLSGETFDWPRERVATLGTVSRRLNGTELDRLVGFEPILKLSKKR